MTTTGAPNPYLRTKVMTASPGQLRLMLLDGAVKFAQQGRQGIETGDREAAFTGISRCQEILIELTNSLDPRHAPELCERLAALYTFLYTRLIDALRLQDAAIAEEVIKLLQYERETWTMVLDRLAEDAGPTAPAAGRLEA